MKLFGKKKKETDPAVLEKLMAEACAKALAEKLFNKIDTKMEEEKYPKGTFFQRPDGTAYTPDSQEIDPPKPTQYTASFVTDINPDKILKGELTINNPEKPKRKYTKKNKEFWGSRKTAQAEEPKEDTLRVFRQRQAAGSVLTPDEFGKMAHEGDVYYIPYAETPDIGMQQSRYSGRVTNRLRTKISTIYGVNGTTHKAENLMKIECLKK